MCCTEHVSLSVWIVFVVFRAVVLRNVSQDC